MAVWHSIRNRNGRRGNAAWTRLGTWQAEVFRSEDSAEEWCWEAMHDGDRRVMKGRVHTREAAQASAEGMILLQEP